MKRMRSYIRSGGGIRLSSRIGLSFLCVMVLIGLVACAFPSQSAEDRASNITDISGRQTFRTIVNQGFMGGSILYNPDKPSAGQLADGVSVAIRLGYVDRTDVGGGQSYFTDLSERAQYGLLVVHSIDTKGLSFSVSLYDATGRPLGESEHELRLNSSADINGDGLADLEYKKPRRKRPGFESAVYLTFLSSQETLNTSMFAVLPEQYSRSAYPSGIIGINPDGRFIIRKYEDSDNTTRSMVRGMQKGDYVLDTAEGKYQRVVDTISTRNARSISDTELEDIDTTIQVDYRFMSEEFTDGYEPEILFSQFPEQVRTVYQSVQPPIDRLNSMLEDRNLIETVAAYQETPIPADIYDEVIAQIPELTDLEAVQLNRVFIEEMYPEYCPQVLEPDPTFTEILPLACVYLGDPSALVNDGDGDTVTTRAATESEYENQRNAIKNEFDGFTRVYRQDLITVPDTSEGSTEVSLEDSFFALGIRGPFTSTWGNVYVGLEGAAYANIDTRIVATIDYSKDLLERQLWEKEFPICSYGPIFLDLYSYIKFNMPVDIHMSLGSQTTQGRFALTWLTGGGAGVGMKYGITWKGFWIFKVPVPYVNFYGGWSSVDRMAYYIGADPKSELSLVGLQFNIHPILTIGLGISVSGIVKTDLGVGGGVKAGVKFNYNAPYVTCDAALDGTLDLSINTKIGLTIPIINKNYSNKWAWPIKSYDYPLKSWQLFKIPVASK